MKEPMVIITVFFLIIALFLSGYFLGNHNKPEIVTKTEYVLQQCGPSKLDYAKFELERQKYFKEKCPNGGQYADNSLSLEIRCFKE